MNNKSLHQGPIFIVGFPRSGTTFLQSLLSTQEGLVSFPETHFFNKAVGHFHVNHRLHPHELSEVLDVLENKTDVNLKSTQMVKERLIDQKQLFELLITALAKKQNIDLKSGVRWIEKTPAHAMFMSKISDYYPNAKFIALKRNPLYAIDSYYTKLVDHRKPHHDLAEEYKKTYTAIEEFANIFPGKVINVSYEDLLLDRNTTMEGLMNFIGEKLNISNLDSHVSEAKKLIREDETWKNNNTDRDFTGLKHNLSLKHILQIQFVLKSFMANNSYPIEKGMCMRLYNMYRTLLNK